MSDRGARGRRTPRLLWILAVAGGFVLPLSLPSTAQSQPPPGRFLISPRGDVIVECNLDLSNCFSVVGGDPSHPVSGATQPSIAANGTIAFSAIWDAFGACIVGGQGICQRHVFLMDPDGSNVRQITFNPANASQFGGDRFPAISPDGTKVAFISNRNPSLDASNNASYLFQVYVVNTDGSGLRQVTLPAYDASGSPHGNMQGVAWSPDSTKLAFKGNVYTTACGTFFGSPIDVEVVGTINLDGTGTTYRACLGDTGTAIALDWSPDGTLIAYDRVSSTLGEPTVAFIDLSGQGRFAAGLTSAQLGTICPFDAHCLHFSPDSTRLAYENQPQGGVDIINLSGTGRTHAAGTRLENGIWWAGGAAIPTATQLTLAPDPVEVWPGFPDQLVPSLRDAGSNLLIHAAATYPETVDYGTSGCLQIGPFGLGFYVGSGNGRGHVSATNAGLMSNAVSWRCWASPPCTYSLTSTSETVPASGGPRLVGVLANPGSNDSSCPWLAASNVPWITMTSSRRSSGNRNVSFTVAPNTGPARQGTLTIAGQTFTVNQAAVGTVEDACVLCYLAEGATGSFFDLDIALANPNAVPAPVTITFLRADGVSIRRDMTLAATSRTTIRVDDIPGLESTAVSTAVDSLAHLPIVVERTMFWDSTYYGGHGEKAGSGAHNTWYFAEGSQGFFDTYFLLANPNSTPITATVRFLTESNGVVTRTYPMGATSRLNVFAGAIPELVGKSFGATVTFSNAGIAERAMYFGTTRFWDGGHDAAGVSGPAYRWFLAEGATGPFFDTYILVANPNDASTTVTYRFLLASGDTVTKVKTLAPNSRLTVNVELEDPKLANTAVSTLVTSDLPVVAERAMYWAGGPGTWYEAHDSFGATELSRRWGLAEGRVGGSLGFETYILMANPNTAPANVRVTFLRNNGSTVVKQYVVTPTSRFNVYVNGFVPELSNESFGAIVEADVPIAVERALYWNALGQAWAGGTNVLATQLP